MKHSTTRVIIAMILVLCMVQSLCTPLADAFGLQLWVSAAEIINYDEKDFNEILAVEDSLTWVVAGDSITHNGSWSQGMNSYGEWLEQYLHAIRRDGDSVVLTGWGGATLSDFQPTNNNVGKGTDEFITKYNPDVVIIKMGMNNRGTSEANFKKLYNTILSTVYTDGAKNGKVPKVVVLTPTPVAGESLTETDVPGNDSVWRMQQWLSEIVTQYNSNNSKHIEFVDLWTAFTSERVVLGEDYFQTFFFGPSDGAIHPNAAGQYMIFKTLAKTLGFYDNSMPIFRQDYGDLNEGYLYVDSTSIKDYTLDFYEMDRTMPTLPAAEDVPNMLASVDFTRSNGEFIFNRNDLTASTLDLTVEAEGVNTLTVEEVRTLKKEYTIVFRAKPNPNSGRDHHPIVYLAGTSGTASANSPDRLMMGMPRKTIHYQVYKDGVSVATLSGTTNKFGTLHTDMNNQRWHTIAIVQSATGLTYYVDGTAYPVTTSSGGAVVINTDIGELFAETTEDTFDAVIGRYGNHSTDITCKTQGDFDFWQLYDGALTEEQILTLSVTNSDWDRIDTNNSLWAVVGAEQMLGYQGTVANRSLLRLLEHTVRNCSGYNNRDIRILPLTAPGYDPEYLVDNYDAIFSEHNYNVFLMLPEVSDVYADGYVHSDTLVAAYKEDIEEIIDKNSDKVVVLWSPLASSDATINGYIDDYAEAVREIVTEKRAVLFFDANQFMKENMAAYPALKTNWFEEDMYISPLVALDLARGFYENVANSLITMSELKDHDLRLKTDKRPLKNFVRDYIAPVISVDGTSVTVNASNILAAYPAITNLRVVVLPQVGNGGYCSDNWENYATIGSDGKATFSAPWSNPVITVCGQLGNYTYRFKDQTVAVTTSETLSNPTYTTDTLTALEVVGAPAIGFDPSKTSYDVTLYQYQRNVRILAQGGDNLSVTVNGESVELGAYSQQIAVDSSATVEVKVTGADGDKTYTLKLTRPDDADVIITEVQEASSNSGLYDLVEIYNASGKELNLLDYALGYKRDYIDSVFTTENMGKYPSYFTGDDHAFSSRGESTQTYTGINAITKNSSFWTGSNVVEEPDYIPFPADSTMVLWVKYTNAQSADSTYETLVKTLQDSNTTYTLPDGTKIVPTTDIISLAERPNTATTSGAKSTHYGTLPPKVTTFDMEEHGFAGDNTTRSWLFVLKNTAVRDDNASITEAGDDIISAAMFVRASESIDMSTVLYYDNDRGMALVKNPVTFDATETGAPYYSSQYSYANYTTFGAIEYWQKPLDQADTQAPTAVDKTPASVVSGTEVTIDLTLTDDTDVRYFELYVKKAGETEYTKVAAKDFVLEAGAKNNGVSVDQTSVSYTYELGNLTEAASYYYVLIDGNNHTVTSEEKTVDINGLGGIIVNNVGASDSGAVLTAPENGWIEGTNTFTVSCDNACVVAVSNDNGNTYTRLTATPVANGYSFTAEMTAGTIVAVSVLGDTDGNGKITNADITKLRVAYAGKETLDSLQQLAADVNGSGDITNADVTKLRAVYAEKTTLGW